ncbi:MAG: tetratricopeptide repeat protein [Flavobacteriales bacterium AspAUS03]
MPKTSERKNLDKSQGFLQQLDDVTYSSEIFLQRHAKKIGVFLTIIVLMVGVYFSYLKLYLNPQQEQALKELFYVKQYFIQDDMKKALGGKGAKGGYLGFAGIVEKYPLTKAANIARYYVGVCYYNLSDYKNAIEAWKKFYTDDEILSSMKYGMIGDAFAQLKKSSDALEYYLKAANQKDNTFTTPLYYYKAALLAFSMDKYQEAKKYFTEVKEKYPNISFAIDVDKYLALIDHHSQKPS